MHTIEHLRSFFVAALARQALARPVEQPGLEMSGTGLQAVRAQSWGSHAHGCAGRWKTSAVTHTHYFTHHGDTSSVCSIDTFRFALLLHLVVFPEAWVGTAVLFAESQSSWFVDLSRVESCYVHMYEGEVK